MDMYSDAAAYPNEITESDDVGFTKAEVGLPPPSIADDQSSNSDGRGSADTEIAERRLFWVQDHELELAARAASPKNNIEVATTTTTTDTDLHAHQMFRDNILLDDDADRMYLSYQKHSQWGCEMSDDGSHTTVANAVSKVGRFPLSSMMMQFWWLCGVPPVLAILVFPLELVNCCATRMCDCTGMKQMRTYDKKGSILEFPVTPLPIDDNVFADSEYGVDSEISRARPSGARKS